MDISEALVSLLPLLAGPASAVIVLLLVGWAAYTLTVKHILPMAGEMGSRHLGQVDALIVKQTETTDAFRHLLQRIEEHLAAAAGAAAGQARQLEILHEIHGVLSGVRTVQAEIRSDVDRLTQESPR